MNKKLPKIYQSENNNVSNNKCSYYSYRENKNITYTEKKSFDNVFFNYFNKFVNITLVDGTSINTKILSKLNNRILLSDGTYLEINKIKEIS